MKVRCKKDRSNFRKNVVYNCDEINGNYIVYNEYLNKATKYCSEEIFKTEFEIIEEKESDNMKIKCIDNKDKNEVLTIGKIYNVKKEHDYEYWIKNDLGEEAIYVKSRFEIIKEEEKENKNMTYKIYEALRMIEKDNTLEFTDGNHKIIFNKIFNSVSFVDNYNKIIQLSDIYIKSRWRLIEKSVAFEEVLNSNKKCKVKHEMVNPQFNNSEYMDFDNLICFLNNVFNNKDLKEIIKNGKWYLED